MDLTLDKEKGICKPCIWCSMPKRITTPLLILTCCTFFIRCLECMYSTICLHLMDPTQNQNMLINAFLWGICVLSSLMKVSFQILYYARHWFYRFPYFQSMQMIGMKFWYLFCHFPNLSVLDKVLIKWFLAQMLV